MLSLVVIFLTFGFIVSAALVRPWIGVVGFYGWAILEPQWNWRWVMPADGNFQLYIALATLFGWAINGFPIASFATSTKKSLAALFLFNLIALLSCQFSIDPELSEWYFSNIWKISLMVGVAVSVIDSADKLVVLAMVVIFCHGYSALQINEQYFKDGFSIYAYDQTWGTKGDNNLYSNLTIPIIAMSISLLLFKANWKYKALFAGTGLLQIHQIMLLQSRGAMLATTGMFGLLVLLMPKTKVNYSIIVIGLLAASILAGPSVVDEFASIFAESNEQDISAQSRWDLWRAGYLITAENPILGVGPYAAEILVPSYLDLQTGRKALHNLLFEISTGCGIPAAILYFLFFLIPYPEMWRMAKSTISQGEHDYILKAIAVAFCAGVPGYLAGSMFSSGALGEHSYVMVACGLIALNLQGISRRFPIMTQAPASDYAQGVVYAPTGHSPQPSQH